MRITLGLLLTLLKLSTNVTANDVLDVAEVEQPCRARAWVRAPDLEPGQVIQGDVKVKLDGACGDVLSYTLRLRFAERSWVKTRREDVQLPEDPTNNLSLSTHAHNKTIFDSDSMLWDPLLRMESPAWAQYREDLRNPGLWLAHEEESIGFETKYNLCDGKALGKEVVESFALIVPTTNYPPTFSPQHVMYSDGLRDSSGAEHIYSYFVDVSFVNGTVLEVPAGYTSFNAQGEAVTATLLPESLNVTLKQLWPSTNDTEVDVDVFTLEITFPHGRHLEQGSVNNITIATHQVGPGKERPDRIASLYVNSFQKRHWAASWAADNETANNLLSSGCCYSSQMKPTNPETESLHFPYFFNGNDELARPKFSQDGTVTSGIMFSTNPVIAQFHVPDGCYPSFQMLYQKSEVELSVTMAIHNITETSSDLEDEDYDWTPTVTHPALRRRIFSPARIPIFIRPKQEEPTKLFPVEIVHYLSPDARVPVFVAPESVEDLQQKSIDERDALTPRAQSRIITHDGSDIIEDRYFVHETQQPMVWYVGDTWFRKVVLPRKKNEQEGQVAFRVQS